VRVNSHIRPEEACPTSESTNLRSQKNGPSTSVLCTAARSGKASAAQHKRLCEQSCPRPWQYSIGLRPSTIRRRCQRRSGNSLRFWRAAIGCAPARTGAHRQNHRASKPRTVSAAGNSGIEVPRGTLSRIPKQASLKSQLPDELTCCRRVWSNELRSLRTRPTRVHCRWIDARGSHHAHPGSHRVSYRGDEGRWVAHPRAKFISRTRRD